MGRGPGNALGYLTGHISPVTAPATGVQPLRRVRMLLPVLLLAKQEMHGWMDGGMDASGGSDGLQDGGFSLS